MALATSLRQRLLSGATKSYGPMLMSDSPIVAEILAYTGYGHIVIDHEHSPTDVRSGQLLLQAIQAAQTQTEAIVRVPGPHDPVYMKKVLDSLRLPGGVLIPMVDDAATAQAVVASTRYPRQQQSVAAASDLDGIRGCAAPVVRASSWGNNPSYLQQCQDDLLVMVQVETRTGIQNIPQIAAVAGVDAIFLGPLDLSCSIGKMGRFDDAEVQEVLHRAEKAVLETGCLLAGFRAPGRDIKEMFDAGYSLICGSLDVSLLRDAARVDLENAKRALES